MRKNIYNKSDQMLIRRMGADPEGGNIYQKHDAVALDNIYSSKLKK
jgi:hypothetical protein